MTNWKIGQHVRIWRNHGYDYGFIESVEGSTLYDPPTHGPWQDMDEVMLVGDDGIEMYCRIRDLEAVE